MRLADEKLGSQDELLGGLSLPVRKFQEVCRNDLRPTIMFGKRRHCGQCDVAA